MELTLRFPEFRKVSFTKSLLSYVGGRVLCMHAVDLHLRRPELTRAGQQGPTDLPRRARVDAADPHVGVAAVAGVATAAAVAVATTAAAAVTATSSSGAGSGARSAAGGRSHGRE